MLPHLDTALLTEIRARKGSKGSLLLLCTGPTCFCSVHHKIILDIILLWKISILLLIPLFSLPCPASYHLIPGRVIMLWGLGEYAGFIF